MESGHFSVTIKNLFYGSIEREISQHFDMGCIDTSSLPSEMRNNESGSYYISGTRKHGNFNIHVYQLTDGKYCLSVSTSDLRRNR